VVDANGYKTTRNICHVTDRAKFDKQYVGDSFADRVWFVEPMKDGEIHVSDFYTSRFTGALCITVSGPLRDEDDTIVGILGLDLKFEDLARMESEEDVAEE
jgi:hypothetical protein